MSPSLQSWAQERGYRVACGSVQALKQARAEIRQRHENAELDEDLYRVGMRFCIEDVDVPPEGTLVLVAMPRPAHRVHFDFEEGSIDALLPPTYVDLIGTLTRVRDDLRENVFVDAGVERLVAPLKATAARLDLVRYGRNNITYAEGMGSYLQLGGYVTDAPASSLLLSEVTEPRLLEACKDCDRCATVCPTGAIDSDRVLVRAHRCLTFANENPGDWPAWVPPKAHHCLMGCLACQRACPVNPPLTEVDTGILFTRVETRALMAGPDLAPEVVRTGVTDKLAQLGLASVALELGRNLHALIDKRKQ